MKIGIITDIHNNLPALEAMLEHFSEVGCAKVICCGDIIGIGPYPEETVRRMMAIPNLLAVQGNHDRYCTGGLPEEFPNDEHMEPGEADHHRWEHAQLSAESVGFLKSLPHRIDKTIDGVRLTVLHYCMDDSGKYVDFVPEPDAAACRRMFADVQADVVLYGHDHARAINRDGDTLYVNCGSLGCPGRGKNVARGGILTLENGRAEVEMIELEYDAVSVTKEIVRLDYPEAGIIRKIFYGAAE